jgi:hypothetical protein
MKAAIIYKTSESVDCDRTNIREQIEDMFDDPGIFELSGYQDHDSMFGLIYDKLNVKNLGVGITVCNVWENKETLYAGYYIDITELMDHGTEDHGIEDHGTEDHGIEDHGTEDKHKPETKHIELSNFGSQITSQHVTGNLIIIKKNLTYDIVDNNVKTNAVPCTLTRFELTTVLEKIFIKTGVAIEPSGSMKPYQYIMNPMEHLILTDKDYEKHYQYHEYEVYTHVMIVIVDTRERDGPINGTATLLAGKPVNGTVFVALYKKPDFNENPPYVGLTVENLNLILSIRQKSWVLTTGMGKSDQEYVNFEKILELESIKHSNMPGLKVSDISGDSLNG